jgi:predicted nucleotidyltransferase
MAAMTAEEFGRGVAAALGGRLVSLVLYGSAVRGGHVAGRSDVNTLLICDRADEALFQALERPLGPWLKAGHPAPLVFTRAEWRDSADVFAVEYEDIRAAHRVLAGGDPWDGLAVRPADVRRQLEHELRGKLVRLRQAYAAFAHDPARLTAAFTASVSGVLTMLRAALRLTGREAPAAPDALVLAAAGAIGFPPAALDAFVTHAQGGARLRLAEQDLRAVAYLTALARVVEFVDRLA